MLKSISQPLIDAIPAEAVLLNRDGTIVAFNGRWKQSAEASGRWSLDAGLGSNYLTRCRSASGPGSEQYRCAGEGIGRVLAGERDQFELDYSYVAPPDMPRHFRLTATALVSEGLIGGALVLHVDITSAKVAQDALRRSEQELRTLADEVPVGIFRADAEGHCMFVNSRWCDMTGLTPAEAMGHGWAAALHPDDRRWLFDTWNQKAVTGEPFHLEYRYRHQDGRVLWVVGSATPLQDSAGTSLGYLGSVTDITHRREIEEALRQAHAHVQAIVAACPLAIIEIDDGGRVFSWSPAAERIFGWRSEEVVGSLLPILPEEKREEFERLRDRASTAEPVTDFETYRLRRDGSRVEVSLSLAPLFGADAKLVRYLGVFSDITRRKQIEEEVERSRERLQQAQKMEAVGRLAGGIAHDFNNLLTAILGYCDLLKSEVGGPATDMVDEVRRGAERAALLTGQLLAFGRKQILQPIILDLAEVLTGVELMVRRLLGEQNRLVLALAEPPVHVFADRGQVEQVIVNLVINARDAMPSGGTVTVRTGVRVVEPGEAERLGLSRGGPMATLLVQDTGTGMPAETLAHLFEPFFTTKPAGQGTGLGLATAHGIIRQSGGGIQVESAPGQGSAFTVLLPLERRSSTRPPGPPAIGGGPTPTGTILVVDDDASVRRPIRAALEKRGYTVFAASDGDEALRIMVDRGGAVDLVLTDVVMPEMNGAELAGRIAQSWPDVPILFMSGYSENEILRQGIHEGKITLIRKPFTLTELCGLLQQALDQARARG